MQLYMVEDAEKLAKKSADVIQETIKEKSSAVLGLATGSTPIATYQELIRRFQAGEVDFSQVTTFNLDEYFGLEPKHPQSYHTFMHNHLFNYINVAEENIHIPLGVHKDLGDVEGYCKTFEHFISYCGGIDLQLLGIGNNGHIGFNEPAEQLQAKTHLVRLSEKTLEANARFFSKKEEVPQYAITMGIQTILSAKKIVLLAQGVEKAEIIQKLFQTGITTDIPASFLKLHPEVIVIVDQAAGSLLSCNNKECC